MNNKVFDIFNINKKKGKKNNEYVVPILKDTSVVENVPTTKEPEEPVLIQKDQLNSTNDLGDIHTEPYRPILQVYPKTKQGTQNKSFGASWYDYFSWLEYSIESNAIYCYVCCIFGNGNSEDTFVKIEFNWKKGKDQNQNYNFVALLITIWYVWQNGLFLNKQKSHVLFTLAEKLQTENKFL
ncbi:hypothetical protein QTP88_003826 [Uroleucon formosanum]